MRWMLNCEADKGMYLYWSKAVLITPNATLVCSCTARSRGVSASVSRKAFTRAASLAQRGRMLASWPLMTGALSSAAVGTHSGISFIAIHAYVLHERRRCFCFCGVSNSMLKWLGWPIFSVAEMWGLGGALEGLIERGN